MSIFVLLGLVGISSALTLSAPHGRVTLSTHLSARATSPRAALDPSAASDLVSSTTNLIAALPSLPGYGGTNSFSESASAQGGGLNQVFALAIGFPTVLCAVVYKDNILSIFEPPPGESCALSSRA